jgi:cytochrome c-type biogenesis protein CcsB
MMTGVLVGLGLTGLIVAMLVRDATPVGADPRYGVDLTPLDRTAVYTQGRVKSFDSFAKDVVGEISGSKRYMDRPADFMYVDLMLRPMSYADADVVLVKKAPMRQRIAAVLRGDGAELGALSSPGDERLDRFLADGLISPRLLADPRVRRVFDDWRRDLIRTARPAQDIEQAVTLMEPGRLQNALRIVPPPDGNPASPWVSVGELKNGSPAADALDPTLRGRLVSSWLAFETAWRNAEPEQASAALSEFTAALPAVAPQLVPDEARMVAESWYFKLSHLTWVWVIYLLAVFFLLLAGVYKWRGARGVGMGLYLTAFTLHTVAIGWRWWVSGRWPNSNMFEAVTTAFWFGAAIALLLELWARRTALANWFALGASVSSMVAMMVAAFSPRFDWFFSLDPNIRNKMPVLHDLWLYIHTNVIIASYALIFMAAVTSVVYLFYRLVGGKPAYAKAGGTETLLRMTEAGDAQADAAVDPVEGEPSDAVAPRSVRRTPRVGTGFGEVLDGATMVLIEMSFVMLWAGIIMGAIWADHSWGRPWAWDPKEVFALNTFLVYLVLIHARVTSKDKGLWTAILSVIGCGVMIFNWLVINFVIAGLHSYA